MTADSCAWLRLAKSRNSEAVWTRRSLSSFSSRAAKSRTWFFNASSSASVSLMPAGLFTVVPHFFQQFLQFVHDDDRPVHAGRKFRHEAALKFIALGVAPVVFRLRPAERNVPCQPDQPAFVSAQIHFGSPGFSARCGATLL